MFLVSEWKQDGTTGEQIDLDWHDNEDEGDWLKRYGFRPTFRVGDPNEFGFYLRGWRNDDWILADVQLGDEGRYMVFRDFAALMNYIQHNGLFFVTMMLSVFIEMAHEEFIWTDRIRRMNGIEEEWYRFEQNEKRLNEEYRQERIRKQKAAAEQKAG